MKYISILRFISVYVFAIIGKILAPIVFPIVYKYKDYIRNYTWNFMKNNNINVKRSTIYKEDENNYYTEKGFIKKRKTNLLIGSFLFICYLWLDDDSDLDCCSEMFSDPEKIKGLNIRGNYFELGDKQSVNKIEMFDKYTFKQWFYWSIIRNGFYNYNYIIEDSIVNSCGEFNLPKDKRMHKNGPNEEEFSEHNFFQDSNGKWFFRTAVCKHFKGFAYGYEIGYYRTGSGGVNAKIRFYWKKPIKKIEK